MSSRPHGQIRQSQVITTYGPGALIDLPEDAAIVGGLESWPDPGSLPVIDEPRLSQLIGSITDGGSPRLYAPPPEPAQSWSSKHGIGAWRFPEWFVVQETDKSLVGKKRSRSRRLVHRKSLDGKRFEGKAVTPTRFVRACPHGHVDDLDWAGFVHGYEERCGRRLWLDERGTTGDLSDLIVRCECRKSRRLYEATAIEQGPLGSCRGKRPWLGLHTDEDCNQPARLLIRTASNAFFPQVLSVLSLPDRGSEIDRAVQELWNDLSIVEDLATLGFIKKKPKVTKGLKGFADADVLRAIKLRNSGKSTERSVKEAELEALLAAPEGYGEDIPVDQNFHARRLPDQIWRSSKSTANRPIQSVTQLHRLREVLALVGFTRFEAAVRDIHGEYDSDVRRANLALEADWFPAVENHGEGVFVRINSENIDDWVQRPPVIERIEELRSGYQAWCHSRGREPDSFPGGPYIMLHTLAHLLIQSMSIRCGYPASSIRERIYVESGQYGLLLYTGSTDAEGTLGGLVQQARSFDRHLNTALEMGLLCSNDPICAQHSADQDFEERWLHGAACHGCTLISETSCEMWNDYLDRALVVPVPGRDDAAFFSVA
ncbi:MAG: DUF1998 domain-containing protein [Acidobacteria bacterium]|nr:DUF1998 domain-containing protein [Acidobacteriota bacterium]